MQPHQENFSRFERMNDYIQWNVKTGFKLVPVIVHQAKNNLPNSNSLCNFIIGVLDIR